MYDHTITLFCMHGDTWYPSVIEGVDLIATESASKTPLAGQTNGDSVEIIVHSSAAKVVKTKAGAKAYVTPKAYAATNAPANCLTFTPEQDFILDAEWPSTDPIPDDAYGDTGLYSAFNEDHDGVYMITSAKYLGLLPHFEIGGR